eukprot:jgi/Ulvmu1/12346/UM089_0030.1
MWFAENPSKRWAEKFFLSYSPFWIVSLLCVVVPLKFYEAWDSWAYLACGVLTPAPLVLYPLLFPGDADRGKPLRERFWLKATVWIAVFGFIGNYFWTHYFFQLLGADYTMPSHRLNNIPLVMFGLTHAYFCLYHALSNIVIRRTLAAAKARGARTPWAYAALAIFILAYVTAMMETVTIMHYPYYTHKNKSAMLTVGSLFYAIYFFVSFPAFFLMDEDPSARRMPLWRAAWDGLASGMLVTILLDFWRLGLADAVASMGDDPAGSAEILQGVPFIQVP